MTSCFHVIGPMVLCPLYFKPASAQRNGRKHCNRILLNAKNQVLFLGCALGAKSAIYDYLIFVLVVDLEDVLAAQAMCLFASLTDTQQYQHLLSKPHSSFCLRSKIIYNEPIPGRPKPQLQLTSICTSRHTQPAPLCVFAQLVHGPTHLYMSQPLLGDECPPTCSTGTLAG